MRCEGELHVRLRLTGLGVEVLGAPRMKHSSLLDHRVAEKGRQRHDRLAVGSDDLVVVDPQPARRVQLRLCQLQNSFANGLGSRLDGSAGDVGLARGGRGAGGADIRVGVQHDDIVDPELGAGDLGLHRDHALPHLGRRRVNLDARAPVDDGEADPRRRVVVESFGVADVLEADGVSDSTLHSLAMGRVGNSTWHLRQVRARGPRQRHRLDPSQQLRDRHRPIDHLAGDQLTPRF